MIKKQITMVREHTRDYEIIIRETTSVELKVFGILISSRKSVLDNTNVELNMRKKAGFAIKEEE